jgi:hypothetical protein
MVLTDIEATEARKIILGVLSDFTLEVTHRPGEFISHGEFFQDALARGYEGDQEDLEAQAKGLLGEGKIDGSVIGRSQLVCYRERTVGGMV